jgi:UDP-glucose 4-epimerase
VTGATGFIGRALIDVLREDGSAVRAAVRVCGGASEQATTATVVRIGEIGRQTDWRRALDGVEVVVHLAARVHVMRESAADPLAAFRRVNTLGTVRLAEQAVEAGVRRLVYVSTIKVNGERTEGRPFTVDDRPQPADPYARSKLEAEQALREVQTKGLEVVVVRPPLVYGPGVKGNFHRLLDWVNRGMPLPFASVQNRRTLVGLTNLVDLLRVCLVHPAAAGQIFLAADGQSLSTPELMRCIGEALGRPARLFPVPVAMLRTAARLFGKAAECGRLCGSLEVDGSAAERLLGWRPRESVEAELARVVTSYRSTLGREES